MICSAAGLTFKNFLRVECMRYCAKSAGKNTQKSAHLVILHDTLKSATTVENFYLLSTCATAPTPQLNISKVSSRSHFTKHTEKRIDSWDFLLLERMRKCENYAGNLFQKWAHISPCIKHTEERRHFWDFLLLERMRNCENSAGKNSQESAHVVFR